MSLSQLNASRHLLPGTVTQALLDAPTQALLATLVEQVANLTAAINQETIRATNAESGLLSMITGNEEAVNLLLPGQSGMNIDIASGINQYIQATINGVTSSINTQNFILSGDVDVTQAIAVYNGNVPLVLGTDYIINIANGCAILRMYATYVAGVNELRITYYELSSPVVNAIVVNLDPTRGSISFNGSTIQTGSTLNLVNGSYPIIINSTVSNVSFVGNGSHTGSASFSVGNGITYLNVKGSGTVTFTI